MHTEKINDPAGETQTFEPRPLPATWVVAAKVRPTGRLESNFGFLFVSALYLILISARELLLEHGVCARYNLPI